ncbi:hypothetical protein OG21DRAFT_1375938, partial [Imleria badia]
TMLSVLFLSVLGTPMPAYGQLEARTTYSGRGTWFHDGLGACGGENTDEDKIVALSPPMYGSGGHCNKRVKITNTANGKTAYGTVRDKCPGCGADDLDMSIGLFEELGNLSTGVLHISWDF